MDRGSAVTWNGVQEKLPGFWALCFSRVYILLDGFLLPSCGRVFFRKHAQATLRSYHLRLRSKSQKRKKTLEALAMPADEIPAVLDLLEEQLLATCSRAEILDYFFVLEGLVVCAEEYWLRSTDESQSRFLSLRAHLLEGFSLNELEDYIAIFKRPYLLLDA